MQVWDGLSDARITFSAPVIEPSPFSPVVASTLGEVAPMATLLENLNLQRGSLRYLQERNKVELLDGRKVLGINADETGWPVIDLEGKDGGEPRSLRARLLVSCRAVSVAVNGLAHDSSSVQIGADGANSPVKSYSKIETFGWAYNIHGIVASLEIAPGNLGIGMSTAWQRFLPEGPIAFLPVRPLNRPRLPSRRLSLLRLRRSSPTRSPPSSGPPLLLLHSPSKLSHSTSYPTSSTPPIPFLTTAFLSSSNFSPPLPHHPTKPSPTL